MPYRELSPGTTSEVRLLSRGVYSLLVSLVALYGLVLTGIGRLLMSYVQPAPAITFLLFIGMLGTMHLASRRIHPVVTFISYSTMTCALGALSYRSALVGCITHHSLLLMAILVIVLGLTRYALPLGSEKSIQILTVMLAFMIAAFVMFDNYRSVSTRQSFVGNLSWLSVSCSFIMVALDFRQAFRIPHTVDNAFQSGANIYLDTIYPLFRVISSFGQKKD